MSRELNGAELASFIKERQAKQVRNLRQTHNVAPKLLVLVSEQAGDVVATYVGLKQRYGTDILVDVEVETLPESHLEERVTSANNDDLIHGIIVQLPLKSAEIGDRVCAAIAPEKDVDGLGENPKFPSATAEAIDWLLAGYNVDVADKHLAIIGAGKLVGAPLAAMWRERGFNVTVCDEHTSDVAGEVSTASVIVSAAGVPRLITSEMVPQRAVVVDAGTTSEHGTIVGDVADEVRERQDVMTTPKRGGVGPLTVAVLFDHVIQAAYRKAGQLPG